MNVRIDIMVKKPEDMREKWVNAESLFEQLYKELEATEEGEKRNKRAMLRGFMEMVDDFSKSQEILESVLEGGTHIRVFFLDDQDTRDIINKEQRTTLPEKTFDKVYEEIPAKFPYDQAKSFNENLDEVLDSLTQEKYNPMTIKRRKKWVRNNLDDERYQLKSGDVILIRGEMYITRPDGSLEGFAVI